jgi:ribosomal protein L37AE/L43A
MKKYIGKPPGTVHNAFACDSCGKNDIQKDLIGFWRCKQCDEDYCESCVKKVLLFFSGRRRERGV